MRILITNDDGINAPVLPHLIRWARTLGSVTVVVPKVEQSGKSHAIDFTRPIEIKQVAIADDITAWSMDSTPADCVRYAILGRKDQYDLVISGINRGLNLGADIMYSGTVGAICEAANLGVHALAFSTSPEYYMHAVEKLDMVYDFIQRNKLLEKNMFYNINIPENANTIRITRQGGPYYSDEFTLRDGMVYPHGIDVFEASEHEDVDTDCVLRCGMVSITPMTNCRVNMALYEDLRQLNN